MYLRFNCTITLFSTYVFLDACRLYDIMLSGYPRIFKVDHVRNICIYVCMFDRYKCTIPLYNCKVKDSLHKSVSSHCTFAFYDTLYCRILLCWLCFTTGSHLFVRIKIRVSTLMNMDVRSGILFNCGSATRITFTWRKEYCVTNCGRSWYPFVSSVPTKQFLVHSLLKHFYVTITIYSLCIFATPKWRK